MTDLASPAPARCLFNDCNSDVPNGKFAFLVHSQDTLPNNLPPKVDDKPLARQKRRRTSPEDQSLLEAEYEKNPKPDKATRMEIVSRVSLGEKEVQIWFQNRRQNTRRKSRPLLPHEIVPSHRSSCSARDLSGTVCVFTGKSQNGSSVGSDNPQDSIIPPLTGGVQVESRQGAEGGKNGTTTTTYASHDCDFEPGTGMDVGRQEKNEADTSKGTVSDTARNATSPEAIPGSGGNKRSRKHTYPLTPGLGYISNRRNILSGSVSLPNATRLTIPPPKQYTTHDAHIQEGNRPAISLRRTSSLVRLSLSLDGKAEVVMSEEESPTSSQPTSWKAPVSRGGSLRRSQSAVDPPRRLDRRLSKGAPLPGAVVGRSRDSRTWEFYCDSEARSASLTQENSGSAIEAINLLRARRKSPLQTSINKRNARIGVQEVPKRLETVPDWNQNQKLSRGASSLARLQTTNEVKTKEPVKPEINGKATPVISSPSDNPGDSDKENWIPGTRQVAGQRRLENPLPKPALVDNTPKPGRRTTCSAADEVDVEESRGGASLKLRESRSSSSVSGEEELDCVQNLLSLREGCWR